MFEIVMGIDDFLIQLVKYCSWWSTVLILSLMNIWGNGIIELFSKWKL